MHRIFLALLLLLPALTFAKTPTTQEYQLKNGLKIIVRVDRRAPVVLASVWYKVGSSYEHSGITGISHVLEHMMFRGTKDIGPGQFDKIIAENGGVQNAFTTADYTMYFQRIAADKLAISFRLEADRMRNLSMQEAVFKKELSVVQEERRMRIDDNPQALTWERFNAAVFLNNPYHHPIAGWMTDLKNMKLADLKRWYQKWYAPNNAVIIVVGDVNPDKVFALAKKYFAAIPATNIPQLKPRTEASSLGVRQVTVNANAKLPWLLMGYNVPSIATAKQAWQPYALEVLSYILNAGSSSRFARYLVRGQQVAVSAGASYSPFLLHSGVFRLSGIPSSGHTVQDLKRAILAQLKQLKTTLVTQPELERVKAQVIAANVYQRDSLMYQAFDLGTPEMIGLSWRVSDQYVARVKAVTPEQIQAVAKLYFVPSRLTIAILKPVTESTTDAAKAAPRS